MAPRDATNQALDAKGVKGLKKISAAEVRKHNSEQDCWMVIRNKVYDVSGWTTKHPGGRVLLTHAGGDATSVFTGFHSGQAWSTLEPFCIGECTESVGVDNAFEREIRALVPEMQKRGLFKASALYYAFKFGSTTAIGLAGIAIAVLGSTFASKMLSALVLAMFWQQCGWLAHDFAHHAVWRNRKLNDLTVLIVGGLYLGFSLDWWKNKHNTHHAIPNVHESATDAHDGDPDIDTLPFLAWSKRLLKKVMPGGSEASPLARFLVANQALVYFPLLLFARATWALQSFAYVFRLGSLYWGAVAKEEVEKKAQGAVGNVVDVHKVSLRYEVLERVALLAHWAWFGALMALTMDATTAACYFAVSQTASGLLIALAFGTGHNGMLVYDADAKPGFAELQVTTTRNVNDTMAGLVGWFMGGLHYQIEHHIFPTIPRHNLKAVRSLVEPICRKHGIPYRSTSLTTGTIEILQHLSTVATELSKGPM